MTGQKTAQALRKQTATSLRASHLMPAKPSTAVLESDAHNVPKFSHRAALTATSWTSGQILTNQISSPSERLDSQQIGQWRHRAAAQETNRLQKTDHYGITASA